MSTELQHTDDGNASKPPRENSMPSDEEEDIFDRVLFLEEEILESSQKEGFIAGLHKGRKDGIVMVRSIREHLFQR